MSLPNRPRGRVRFALLSLAMLVLGCSDDSSGPRGGTICVGDTAVFIPSIGGESDSVAVTVCGASSGRVSWQAEESADWFAVAPASGSTPGWFRVAADRNESDVERRGTIHVSASGTPGIPKRVAVVQAPAGPYLCVAPDAYEFPPEGGASASFSVTNCGNGESIPWLVSFGVDWLSCPGGSGTTPGAFTMQAQPNASGAPRSTTVIVYDPDAPLLARLVTVHQPFSRFAGSRTYTFEGVIYRVGAGDIDRDGDEDIVVEDSYTGAIGLLRNAGNGSFWVEGGYAAGPRGIRGFAAADLSGDGYPDLLFYAQSFDGVPALANLCYLESLGVAGGFEEGVYALVPGDIVELLVADLDRDGDTDFAYLAQRYGLGRPLLGVLLNKGEADFLGPYEYELMAQPECGDLGDVDGDGDLDVLFNGEGRFVIMENNGAGSFSWLGNSDQFAGASDLALGDFDGDGDPDCAAIVDRQIVIMRNAGNGSYNVAAIVPATANARDLRAADVTEDGIGDILWADRWETLGLRVLESGGTLIDWAARSYASGGPVGLLHLADIDADGDLDAITSSGIDGRITATRNYSR